MKTFDFIDKDRVFIIAELSANHNGSLETAIKTIRAAKRSGADAIKLQTYTADTLTIDSKKSDFIINNGSIWDGKNLYELYQEAHTPWEWHHKLFEIAKEEGLVIFSSPFDKTAVDFLEGFEVPVYKISSFEITDIQLIEYIASKGKPIILSTGIATIEDIELALKTIRSVGDMEIALLKCTSSYPAPIEEANLVMIKDFKNRFGVISGLSDHTLGYKAAVIASCLGAKIIEKHFIIDKSIGGPDASFSLDEKEFTRMVQEIRDAEKAIGNVTYKLTEKQKAGKSFSRSLYAVKEIKIGEEFKPENIRSIRPGYGLHPKYLNNLLGTIAKRNIKKGDRLNKNDLL